MIKKNNNKRDTNAHVQSVTEENLFTSTFWPRVPTYVEFFSHATSRS